MASPNHTLLLSLVVLLSASSLIPQATSALCNSNDKRALLAINAHFNNHFISWVPTTDCCSWRYVGCDSNGRVTSLSIYKDANLTGTIPTAISSLPFLNLLALYNLPGLKGPIPPALSNLHHLETLIISITSISGHLPSFLSSLPSLTYVMLSHNKFTGDATLLFGHDKPLATIDLSYNKFQFNMSNVVFPKNVYQVDLNHNKIHGSIPQQITALSNLQSFDVSYNKLCGLIPIGGKMSQFDQNSYLHNKCLCGTPLAPCK